MTDEPPVFPNVSSDLEVSACYFISVYVFFLQEVNVKLVFSFKNPKIKPVKVSFVKERENSY